MKQLNRVAFVMSQSIDSSMGAEASRSSCETDQGRKKQKKKQVTFSDPNSLVTFLVGGENNSSRFTVHKEVVCSHSEVLSAAFNSNFIEGQTQTYRLEDTTERAFTLFMQWLYSQKLVLTAVSKWPGSATHEEVGLEILDLEVLWVLADKLGMPSLQNAALKFLHDLAEKTGFIDGFQYVYQNIAAESPLRKYIVASLSFFDPDNFVANSHRFPPEMLVDFGRFMLRKSKGLENSHLDVSDYLVKEDEGTRVEN